MRKYSFAKVVQWRNYDQREKQIQLRTRSGGASVNVPHRRLADLVCRAVRNAMSVSGDAASGTKQKDVRKWFETCFTQIHKMYDSVRIGLEAESNTT